MARIELRDCDVIFRDGFGGTAAINGTPQNLDTVVDIDTIADLTNYTNVVPVGARFNCTGHATTHTVTAANSNEVQTVAVANATDGTFTLSVGGEVTSALDHDASTSAVKAALALLSTVGGAANVDVTGTPGAYTVEFKGAMADIHVADMVANGTSLVGEGATVTVAETHEGAKTWQLTFTPAFVTADLPGNNDVVNFLPQQLTIKVGDGNITYTEHREYQYLLDKGDLDTVREGNSVPMDVKLDCVYEHITTGTSEAISPMDALKQVGAASGWVTTGPACEPYAIDIVVDHEPDCGAEQGELTVFPDFRADTKEINFKDATISVSGKCNVTEPIVSRF